MTKKSVRVMGINYKRSTFLALSIIIFIFSFSGASADYGTHINITIAEIVYQNVTFAENFDLNESTDYCKVDGVINITNINTEPMYDIYIRFKNTELLSSNFSHDPSTKYGYQVANITPGEPAVLHIPLLRQNNYSTFTYNVSCADAEPPININTSYANLDHGFNKKVLTGENWTVTQNAINENWLEQNITNVNITIEAQQVNWNGSRYNFTIGPLLATGDWIWVQGNHTAPISNMIWSWQPNGGNLTWNTSKNITFYVTAPITVPFTASYMAIKERIEYNTAYLMSNLSLDHINASSDLNISFEKRIDQPQDNLLNHNVTWEIRPYIVAKNNITYDLTTVSMWVTEDQSPANYTEHTVNYSQAPYLKRINLTTNWGNSTYYWYFNYTDGSNSTYPPPIVWLHPTWRVSDVDDQIVNYTTTASGEDYYMKYIYVINGYWLEISKNITSIGEDQFRINTLVLNIGNGWTPANEYVTVYDFVPGEFGVWNLSDTTNTTIQVGSPGDSFYGYSYRWNIPWKDGKNSSLGPMNGPNATNYGNYSWNVSYNVNGSGPYRATDLYIIGLDPLKVDGASVSPVISIISGFKSHSSEVIYITIVAFLIAINLANLIITNKINKKLDKKGTVMHYPGLKGEVPRPKKRS
jgi:hypothetical protein